MSALMFCVAFFVPGGPAATLRLQPFDFQDRVETLSFSRIDQVSTDGRYLYITSVKSTEVAVLDASGQLVKVFGGRGGHPSELGDTGVYAFCVAGNDTWAIDTNSSRARRFEQGSYLDSFSLKTTNLNDALPGATLIAASEEELVLPIRGENDVLARVFDLKGALKQEIGSPLIFDNGTSTFIPGINDTVWLQHGDSWYSIHRFVPVITRYDRDFEITGMVRFRNRTTEQMERWLEEFVPSDKFSTPPPMITDAQFHRDSLYVLCGKELLKLDEETGVIQASYGFQGEGPDFGPASGQQLMLFSFAILGNRVFLAHPALLWNHDMWFVDLPKTPGN